MNLLRAPVGMLIVGALAAGCGAGPSVPVAVGNTPPPQQAVAQSAPAPKSGAPAPKGSEAARPPLPPMTYDAKGRRDPFTPIQIAKEKITGLDVSTVKLVGVISGSHLLALVEAPDGLGYIVKSGDVLGNGRVTDVAPTSITFTVAGADKKDTSLTLRLVRE
jgi:hypothetical protein